MATLFCNISWMKYYKGRSVEDPPLGGGGFPRSEGYCHEECNFVVCEDGYVYGHFETIKGKLDRQVLIERLGASKTDDFIDDVDIIWTAPKNGNDPRTVVGWSRKARLYRRRQKFDAQYPSAQHHKDEIKTFMVKAKSEDVFLLPPEQRNKDLQRGNGWSGQASWWYADDKSNRSVARFVADVRALMNGKKSSPSSALTGRSASKKKERAGAAASEAYRRYIEEYEILVHPRHHLLQTKFKEYLSKNHRKIYFPKCVYDDFRYEVEGQPSVMVEVKPTSSKTIRFALRTAIGQLLDYRQHQKWSGRQLILVEKEVKNAGDIELAFKNGFGLAWPIETAGSEDFTIQWP